MQNNNRKVTVWLYLFYGIIYPYLYWINFGMKKILLFSLVMAFSSRADLCDDLFKKHKSAWEGTSNLNICKNALKGDPDAQFDLAGIFSIDENNPEEAFEWTRKSASQGCTKSQYVLGLMYYDGVGVDMNWIYAFELFERSSKKELPNAITSLGFMYQNGHMRAKDLDKAKELYVKASYLGDPTASYLLGEMYKNGDGVEVDTEKAAFYFLNSINSILKAITADDKNTYPCNKYNDLTH
ncbi:tetratricopeptide repeat protein [Providencia manganoxydans]